MRVYTPSMRTAAALVLLLAVLTCGMRILYTGHQLVVGDEFEHIHAAYLVSRGERPYVDFFEHHTPLFYYLAAIAVPMTQPTFDTIIRVRYMALGFAALTTLLAGLWMWRQWGRTEALVVLTLLLTDFFLFARGSLSYLDTYAAPLLVLSAMLLAESRGRPLRGLASGAALGLAILFTQKATIAAAAPAIWFVAGAARREDRASWRMELLAFAAGATMAATLLPALLGTDGLAGFFRDNVLLNLGWKARHFPTKELAALAVTGGGVYVLAVAGALVQLRSLWMRRLAVIAEDVPVLFLVALSAGIAFLPVVWEEYFILLVPFLLVNAGITVVRGSRHFLCAGNRSDMPPWVSTSAAARGLAAALAITAVCTIIRGASPLATLSPAAVVGLLAIWAAIALLMWSSVDAPSSYRAALWLAVLVAFPLVQQADWIFKKPNDAQRRRVDYVMRTTAPDDTVFDGYSGYGLFRTHAYRYWFLHDEVQAMLSREQKGREVIAALERQRTPVVIDDQYVDTLPAELRNYIHRMYQRTSFPDIKRRRLPSGIGGETSDSTYARED